ncbi:MAG: hypothetical protein QUV07_12845 [Cyanobium sp. CZS 25K]|nr:hypothetical protein [Cyanobium sp. CZS25K]
MPNRSPRAPWRRRWAAGLTAGLVLLVPSIGRTEAIVEPGNGSLAPSDTALSLRKSYAAGEALGEWRRLCPASP